MLSDKYKFYLQNYRKDKHGFIESHSCDSLLFTGLTGCNPDISTNIDAAFDGTLWHRRPTDNPCFDCATKTDLGSKSSISRDMLLGLAWYAYYNKRLDISEQVIKHAMSNWGFMGQAVDRENLWGRCQIMPSLFATFCWISYRLGGPSRAWARWIPADVGPALTDYQAHLQVLHILLRRDLTHKLIASDKKKLEEHYKRSPMNPLFAYATGRIDIAIRLLENQKFWPENRLPTKQDRNAEWLMMREAKDWSSSSKSSKIHSGADFLFMYWLIFRNVSLHK